jgi:hypothetical protein
MPEKFKDIIKKGPGHKSNFSGDYILRFLSWLKTNKTGKKGNPYDFSDETQIKCKS